MRSRRNSPPAQPSLRRPSSSGHAPALLRRACAAPPPLVGHEWQVWRIFTNFFFFGSVGLDFFFHMFFLVRYCRLLEEGCFRGRTADFLYMILFGEERSRYRLQAQCQVEKSPRRSAAAIWAWRARAPPSCAGQSGGASGLQAARGPGWSARPITCRMPAGHRHRQAKAIRNPSPPATQC